MHMIRRFGIPLLAGFVLAAATIPAHAGITDISDTPMAVKNNVPPNFMYMLDNSGSMSNIVPDEPYSASTTYLNCPSNRIVSSGFTDPANPTANAPIYNILITSNGTTYFYDPEDTYRFGTGSNRACFNPSRYYRARLLANNVANCGNGIVCKNPGSYLSAVYSGNYLNWYFGDPSNYTSPASLDYATGRKLDTKTRLEIAKSSANAVLDTIPLKTTTSKAKARVGLVTYNGSNGGTLLRNVADLDSTHLANVKTSIAGLTAASNTPLAETLADIGHYFTLPHTGNLKVKGNDVSVAALFRQGSSAPHTLAGIAPTNPVQYWCQRSYAILMTDGRPQADQALANNSYLCNYDGDIASRGSGNPRETTACYFDANRDTPTIPTYDKKLNRSYESEGSDYLDDVAQALYEIDLRPDLAAPTGRTKKNNLRTYTVSFADDQASNDPLLREAATQGGGTFQIAGNEAELLSAFSQAMNDAFAKDGASAAVAVANTQLTIDNTAYASSYNSGYWTGDLQAFAVDTSTGIPGTTAIWSAQARLNQRQSPATNRRIVTYNGTDGVPFRPANITLTNSGNSDLINYLRGDNTHADGVRYRKRAHLLGDIVNAEPVVVKYSDGTPVIYQPANDGMLHVFNGCTSTAAPCGANGGQELWAYVPQLIWDSLKDTNGGLADPNYAHKYLVDATPAVADVPVSNSTMKLLVGGLGKGGKGYYALDITDYSAGSENTYASKVKWEFPTSAPSAASSVGYSYGTPLIVNSPDGWVVLVPSGHNNSDGSGKLFVLNPQTGALLHTISTGAGSASDPAGLAHVSKLFSAGPNDVITHVYGGDLLGNVWRFDLTNHAATRIAVLRDGSGNRQPVSTAPAVGRVSGSTNKYFVYVGTGLYLGDSDIPGNTPENGFATQTQSMYGIIDDTSIASPSLPNIRGTNGATCPQNGNGDFLCQDQGSASGNNQYTGTSRLLGGSHRGWYFDLPIEHARVVTHPQLSSGGTLFFTINVPTNALCDPGGQSFFATVDASNGGAIATEYGSSSYHPTIIHAGHALASRPVLVITASGGRRAVIRMSDQTFISPPVPEPPTPSPNPAGWRRIYWRELM